MPRAVVNHTRLVGSMAVPIPLLFAVVHRASSPGPLGAECCEEIKGYTAHAGPPEEEGTVVEGQHELCRFRRLAWRKLRRLAWGKRADLGPNLFRFD